MTAYYNEIDPYAAAWLRNLIDAGHIAPGDVDTRSIEDVTPDDLRGYAQCHFFAGIGVWSHALRRAGWPDDKPVWTGSCPCQPFSAAGKGAGFADERHLWPAWHYLIEECRPPVVFGEQVASKDGLGWLDLVQADMEAAGYALGPVDLCAAGIGAPHIRQRLWFVGERLADTVSGRQSGPSGGRASQDERASELRMHYGLGGLADTDGGQSGKRDVQPGGQLGLQSQDGSALRQRHQGPRVTTDGLADAATDGHTRDAGAGRQAGDRDEQFCSDGGMANSKGPRRRVLDTAHLGAPDAPSNALADADHSSVDGQQRSASARPGPTNGHWGAADWLFCRDGKWRPVEPSTFPLAHGAANRVGRLRAYGNAIVAQAAQEVITAYMADEAADLI